MNQRSKFLNAAAWACLAGLLVGMTLAPAINEFWTVQSKPFAHHLLDTHSHVEIATKWAVCTGSFIAMPLFGLWLSSSSPSVSLWGVKLTCMYALEIAIWWTALDSQVENTIERATQRPVGSKTVALSSLHEASALGASALAVLVTSAAFRAAERMINQDSHDAFLAAMAVLPKMPVPPSDELLANRNKPS